MKEISIEEKIVLKMLSHKSELTVEEELALSLFSGGYEIEVLPLVGFYEIKISGVHLMNVQTVVNIINV